MSEKLKNAEITAKKSFSYRCFKKDFTEFDSCSDITNAYHLEQIEGNEIQIVEDRKDDWFALAQKGVEQVGLANILELAKRQQFDPYDGRYSFKDEEALDLGDLDSNDPESINKAASSVSNSAAKIEALAKSLGVSTDDLLKAVIGGTLDTLIQEKVAQDENKEKEDRK